MKRFFLTTISAFIALFAAAQTTDVQIATLQHGDETKIFTGVNAFVDAYNAAADSLDIITLSSGVFNVPGGISKQICVYGAGHTADTIAGIKPTIINSTIHLHHRDGVDENGYNVKALIKVDNSHFEGLYISGEFRLLENTTEIKNVVFNKCLLTGKLSLESNTSNISVVNCIVKGGIRGKNNNHGNLYVTNSVFSHIGKDANGSDIDGTVCIDHCMFAGWNVDCNISNSIISGYNINCAGSTLENNIFVGNIPSGATQNKENWSNVPLTAIFEEGTYEKDDWSNDYILRYPNKYLGTDGTQVGIHGGLYPFGRIPSIPRIIESKIDTETSVDGKLKVSIKAQAQTK